MIVLYVLLYIVLSYVIAWACGLGILKYENGQADKEFVRGIFLLAPIFWWFPLMAMIVVFTSKDNGPLSRFLDVLFGAK